MFLTNKLNEFVQMGVDDFKFSIKKHSQVKNKDNVVFKEKGNICKVSQTLFFYCGGLDSETAASIELVDDKVYILKKENVPTKIYGHQLVTYND